MRRARLGLVVAIVTVASWAVPVVSQSFEEPHVSRAGFILDEPSTYQFVHMLRYDFGESAVVNRQLVQIDDFAKDWFEPTEFNGYEPFDFEMYQALALDADYLGYTAVATKIVDNTTEFRVGLVYTYSEQYVWAFMFTVETDPELVQDMINDAIDNFGDFPSAPAGWERIVRDY